MIVATAVSVAVAPLLSVTVNVTVYTPDDAYECDADTPVAVAPSPKFHAYEAIVPSASVEAAPLNDNRNQRLRRLVRTRIRDRRTVRDRRHRSVGRGRTLVVGHRQRHGVHTRDAYECDADTPVAVAPSPKFQAYEAIVPSASVEPAPLNDNATSVCAD